MEDGTIAGGPAFHLFERYGIELEYMIVRGDDLSVLPVSDAILLAVAGDHRGEVERGELCWSNELVLHVIELKTNGPVPSLDPLPPVFARHISEINDLLLPLNGRLMPAGMHPWMDPQEQTRIWPHEYSPVYEAFDRIFNCRGHGWSNLQSVHLNLPFADDLEFSRLHASIRLLLPILPALAASSPIIEGRFSGFSDYRVEVYRTNCSRIPSVTADVIPEAAFSAREYEEKILQPMYQDIAPYDPEAILQYEWLNARGAIARFDRNTIEIRLMDMQECPGSDLAVCAAVVEVLRSLVGERWTDLSHQQSWQVGPLKSILTSTIRDADEALVDNRDYLRIFGFPGSTCTAGELWSHLIESLFRDTAAGQKWKPALQVILRQGPLARRILKSADKDYSRENLLRVYETLCDCLARNQMFLL